RFVRENRQERVDDALARRLSAAGDVAGLTLGWFEIRSIGVHERSLLHASALCKLGSPPGRSKAAVRRMAAWRLEPIPRVPGCDARPPPPPRPPADRAHRPSSERTAPPPWSRPARSHSGAAWPHRCPKREAIR